MTDSEDDEVLSASWGGHAGSNRFGRIHGRECFGDRTSIEQTLGSGSLSSTRDSKLRHIIFVIIESGMALFAIQLVRVVISSLLELQVASPESQGLIIALSVVVSIHQTLNVIIRSVFFLLLLF